MVRNEDSSNIYKTLSHLNFSKDSNLKQIMVDWPRLQGILRINGETIADVANNLSIDLNNLHPDEIDDQKKMKTILTTLFTDRMKKDSLSEQQSFDPNTFDFNQLGEILHQGGILFSLEAAVKETLNQNDMYMPQKGFSRVIDLITTDNGFDVKQLFEYNADILDKNDPEIIKVQKPDKPKMPVLTGICKYSVEVNQENVTPKFEGFQLATQNKTLQPILTANTLHQNSIKAKLQEAKTSPESNLESDYTTMGLPK